MHQSFGGKGTENESLIFVYFFSFNTPWFPIAHYTQRLTKVGMTCVDSAPGSVLACIRCSVNVC